MHIGDQARARSTLQNEKSSKHQGQHGSFPEPRSNNGFSSSSYSPTTGANFYKTETEFLNGENLSRTASAFSNETVKPNCCLEKTAAKGVVKTKSLTNPQGIKNAKLPKSPGKVSGEHLYVEKERKREIADESSRSLISFLLIYLFLLVNLILFLLLEKKSNSVSVMQKVQGQWIPS